MITRIDEGRDHAIDGEGLVTGLDFLERPEQDNVRTTNWRTVTHVLSCGRVFLWTQCRTCERIIVPTPKLLVTIRDVGSWDGDARVLTLHQPINGVGLHFAGVIAASTIDAGLNLERLLT
jgi:hypothetical protein